MPFMKSTVPDDEPDDVYWDRVIKRRLRHGTKEGPEMSWMLAQLIADDDAKKDDPIEILPWRWIGGVDRTYGMAIASRARKTINAQRFIYSQILGPLPKGVHLRYIGPFWLTQINVNPNHYERVS